jgi:hypothetical protein
VARLALRSSQTNTGSRFEEISSLWEMLQSLLI